jgi:Zn-dependent protease with chaperone function
MSETNGRETNGRNPAAGLLCVALAAALSGCATNTITGRSQLMMVSEESAIRGSASAYNRMVGGLHQKGKIEAGTPRAERAREITDKLIAQAVRFRPDSARWQWELQVIQDPKVNAFCMAGGKMAIYTGFWDKLHATDDEIAAVMGHEIGHALASHTREKMSVDLTAKMGAMVAAAVLSRGDPASFSRNADALQGAAAVAVTLPNSREAETEADQIGIELAARAGFDPRGAVTLWEKMLKKGGGMPEFLSTHPSHETRIQNLSALVPKVEPLYLAAKGGKPAGGVPAFIGPAANANAAEREAYAARAAQQPDAMTFVSAAFEKFRSGGTVFDCELACVFSYGTHRGDWKKLYDRKAWRELAMDVLQVGYLNDLSYFLLAEAAAGMNLPEAARAYYRRASEAAKAGKTCSGGLADTCEGIDVKR